MKREASCAFDDLQGRSGMGKHHDIRLGASGWHYHDWVGSFYPEGAAPGSYLVEYAHHYDIVEVDSTARQIPSTELIDEWRMSTPRKFQFVVRAPGVITHEKVLQGSREEFRAFVETVRGLENKLHSVLLQFDTFSKQAFPQHTRFFERLDEFLESASDEVPIAVEIRNRNWLTAEWFELLRRHHAMPVLVDHPWLTPIAELAKKFDLATGSAVFIRLLGDVDAMEKRNCRWDKAIVDRAGDLESLAETATQLVEKSDVIVLADNRYAGHAPSTLAQFATFMGRAESIDD